MAGIGQGQQKEPFSGRQKPNYEPSGHSTYNSRWRKQERRERAVARQKALYDSDRLVKKPAGHEAVPMDWKMMLPESEREGG